MLTEKERVDLVEQYAELKKQEEALSQRKEELQSKIIKAIEDGDDLYAGDIQLTVRNSSNYKYDDNAAIVEYLKRHRLTHFIVKSIDTKALNKELRNNEGLSSRLGSYFHIEVVSKVYLGVNKEEK